MKQRGNWLPRVTFFPPSSEAVGYRPGREVLWLRAHVLWQEDYLADTLIFFFFSAGVAEERKSVESSGKLI